MEDELFGGYDYNLFSYLKDCHENKKNKENLILKNVKEFVKNSKK